jgi:AAA domain (dynein-related subfamily)
MTTIKVRTLLEIAPKLPVETSILLRGKHGIGKSDIVRQIAAKIGVNEGFTSFPVIDRRMSQMSEGDMLGLPIVTGNSTKFLPPDWFVFACENPCALFLDELNRASIEVMQCAFQIVLNREMNGHKLHPQTRVFAAVNNSSEYTINEIDPALLDRFWCVDVDPDTKDWIKWAQELAEPRIHENVVEFIRGQDKWLDPSRSGAASDVSPSRRSWEFLNRALLNAGLMETPGNDAFYHMSLGFVGTEATIAFHSFVSTIDNAVTGEEIINDYKKVKPRLEKLGQEKLNIAVEKVTDYCVKNLKELDKKQAKNFRQFMQSLPGELRVACWCAFTAAGVDKLELTKSAHPHVIDLILEVVGVKVGGDPNQKPVIPEFMKKQQEEAAAKAAAK